HELGPHAEARDGCRVQEQAGEFQLLRGLDPAKDQSYFLHRLNQAQLSKTLFPVGELEKTEVRRIAQEIGLPNAKKKDSTGICFIGERPFREFLNRYLPTQPGPMKTPDGKVVGEHIGLAFYTLGQRKGIGLGGSQSGSGEPWFVARKDMATNTLWVVQGHDHPWLLSNRIGVMDASWTSGRAPATGTRLGAKTRYRQTDGACTVTALDGEPLTLDFEQAQWAATPGQSAVLYDGEVCLGGGIIETITTSA
ncbi:MAG: tRNA 2-thiouridine(34) synthase MnmA, partial [Burkholderiaceae bacterium]